MYLVSALSLLGAMLKVGAWLVPWLGGLLEDYNVFSERIVFVRGSAESVVSALVS